MMAKITDNKVTITFDRDEMWLTLEMNDEHDMLWISDGNETVQVPRAEAEQFATMIATFVAEHP